MALPSLRNVDSVIGTERPRKYCCSFFTKRSNNGATLPRPVRLLAGQFASARGPTVFAALHRILAFCLILTPVSAFASTDWQPTPDELKMTSYAPDPNAPAVYLFREETVDDTIHLHSVDARVKILSEKGKEMFGDIEIPYEGGMSNIRSVSGRTIHSDGTVIPFTGKPMDKLLAKQGHERIMAKVFSMPDVQVGSIVEYRWILGYDDSWLISPHWLIQQDVPVLKEHYHFASSSARGENLREITTSVYGHEITSNQLLYTYVLPAGDKPVEQADGSYDAIVKNIPALPKQQARH